MTKKPVTEIYKSFTFDAAHRLTKVPIGHKCAEMHGHTYHLIVYLRGDIDARGMIADYEEIANACQLVLRQLDHHVLNDVFGLENPTTEILARWIWRGLKPHLTQLRRVEVKESSTTGCVYCE